MVADVVRGRLPNLESDEATRRRELDGVADEVGDDLLHPEGVGGDKVGDSRVDVEGELQLLRRRSCRQGLQD